MAVKYFHDQIFMKECAGHRVIIYLGTGLCYRARFVLPEIDKHVTLSTGISVSLDTGYLHSSQAVWDSHFNKVLTSTTLDGTCTCTIHWLPF